VFDDRNSDKASAVIAGSVLETALGALIDFDMRYNVKHVETIFKRVFK